MELIEAIQHAIDGNAVLFVGSGFSYGAKNLLNESPMTGRAFAKELYKMAGVVTDDDNLMLASQIYIHKFNSANLTDLCRNTFTIKKPESHHVSILGIPWQRIYTTNYDDLLERSAVENGKALVPTVLEDAPEKYLSSSRVCVHLNGLITRLSVDDLNSNFKLTLASYLQDNLSPSPWSSILRQDLRLARAVIFVGYSMYDLDVQRLVHAEDIKEKTFFIASPKLKPSDPDSIILPIFGNLLPIGVEKFSSIVDDVKKIHTPEKTSTVFTALEKLTPVVTSNKPTNADIERLFLYGKLENELISQSSLGLAERFYLVEREEVENAKNALTSGRDVVFTSELGNGKTILTEQLAMRLLEKGWNIFRLTSDSKESRKEGTRLLDLSGNTAILVDNYIPLLDYIDYISVRRMGKNIRFILTARSHVHEVFLDRLENALRTTEVPEFDVNRMSKDEANNLISMIDSFGLWAEFSAWSDVDKIKLIQANCDYQIQQVLLRLYKSPHISQKIIDLFSSITQPIRRIVIAAMISRGSGLSSDKRILNDLLIGSPLIRLSNSERESVKFLWEDSNGQIRLKSSALSEHYLTNLADGTEVTNVLIEMFTQAHSLQKISKDYEYFMRSVMSFSALQKLIPKNGLRPATIKFYEAIQTTTFVRKNPHYWLQYAIARLSFEDELNEIAPYFESAYVHAKNSNYDTYQIDNHYARFLLAKSIREENVDSAFSIYLEAKRILLNQTLHEKKHYPYRVAKGVQDFWQTHGLKLNPKQRKDIEVFCSDVLLRIEKLPQITRNHRHVAGCRAALNSVIAELKSITN